MNIYVLIIYLNNSYGLISDWGRKKKRKRRRKGVDRARKSSSARLGRDPPFLLSVSLHLYEKMVTAFISYISFEFSLRRMNICTVMSFDRKNACHQEDRYF